MQQQSAHVGQRTLDSKRDQMATAGQLHYYSHTNTK